MITEAYVSFETVKLLKDKGFNEPTIAYTYGEGMINYYSSPKMTDERSVEAGRYPLPTLQMVMKWLRKEHGLHIIPRISRNTFLYGFKVVDSKGNVPCVNNFVFDSNEEACETAIKYCLENLI